MLHTMGFPINNKENENRRAIVPDNIKLMKHQECLFIEKGYGKVLGVSDDEYAELGCQICDHDEVLQKDIICDPKIGDADYLERLHPGQVIFCWVHATQNIDITDRIVNS